ncbi:phosphotransferase family protein [Nocardia goodfellowii]|uniref:Aminoglycoside phosphotransferase (APT) family kinase protein n=1 Tax=Nocardia goodfellowii TaxID=882446 RepID=A0ABS4QN66_9NOCA|nr:aminoglycoside phosphotransferase family protein [Nocardia goodfellowii]MBP2193150.1 aminoglycoside phosphotransferase (APT) family kinase protein [Nocardia goodfellowii]
MPDLEGLSERMPGELPLPHGPAEITAPWLSRVLDMPIDHLTVTPFGTGQTGATYRVRFSSNRSAAGKTDTRVVKLSSQDESVRARVALGYRAEHAFYRDVAHTVAVPVPRVYHCAIDRDGADFVLVMADLAPAVQGDQLAGCDAVLARLAVEALAGLHGPRWCDPAWLEFPAATMPKAGADFARGLGELARAATATTLGCLGAKMTAEDRETLRAAADLVEPWLLAEPARFSLLHGDYRLDNLLVDTTDNTVTVVDWQTLSVGLPARDLAYFLATCLQPALRREHERRLVADYHAALRRRGVLDYSDNECWTDYRFGLLQVPLITTLGFAFSAETDRGDDMVLTMLSRGCRALRDHETFALVKGLANA